MELAGELRLVKAQALVLRLGLGLAREMAWGYLKFELIRPNRSHRRCCCRAERKCVFLC